MLNKNASPEETRMSWFNQPGPKTEEYGLEAAGDTVSLRLPLQTEDERICAWIHLSYSVRSPLTVDIAICSPSGATAVERTLLRRDMRMAMFEPVLLPGCSVGPSGAPGLLAFVFQEESIAVPVTVPAPVFAEFLRACDALVPMNERAEAIALTNALHMASQYWV
jgi:hypothetical protein